MFTAPESRLLKNTNNYPLILSLTCMTGIFTDGYTVKNCFANEAFRYDLKGAMGVFASNSTVVTSLGNYISNAFIDTLFPNPGLATNVNDFQNAYYSISAITPPHLRIGDVINNSWSTVHATARSFNYSESELSNVRASYHYFGDATMDYYLYKPNQGVYSKSLWYNNTYMMVDTPLNSTLVFYNPAKNLVTYGYGKQMTYTSDSATIDQMCFSVRPYRGLPGYYMSSKASALIEKDSLLSIEQITQSANNLSIQINNSSFSADENYSLSISNVFVPERIQSKDVTTDLIEFDNISSGIYVLTIYKNGNPYEYKKISVK